MYISNSMNNIYRKEQEVSSKENNVKSNARNINSLSLQREYNNQSDYRIYNSWPLLSMREHFFLNTLHFHQKVSQKHIKIKIQSLEHGLPGTVEMKLLIGGFEAESLLAHWIQAVAPLMANLN